MRNKIINHKMIWIWLAVSLICIYILSNSVTLGLVISFIIRSLAFSSIWVVGFLIWKFRKVCYTNRYFAIFSLFTLPLISRLHLPSENYNSLKYLIFAIVSCPFFLYVVNPQQPKLALNKAIIYIMMIIYIFAVPILWLDEKYLLIVKCLYISFPFVMLILNYCLKSLIKCILKKIMPLLIYLGKISYSFYLIHFPTIIFVNSLAIPLLIKLILIISFIGFSTYLLEILFQPFLNKKLK